MFSIKQEESVDSIENRNFIRILDNEYNLQRERK
jgi:hypothetical protein